MPAWLRALPNVGGDVPNSMLARSIVHLIGLCFSAGTGTFLRYNRLKIIIFATQLNDAVGAPAMVGWFQKDPIVCMEKPLWNTGNGNPASGWENRCPGQTPRIVASRSLLIRRVLGIVPGFFIDFECAQVCNLRRRPENLWLKVILFLPGDMEVTGDSENPATGRQATKHPNPLKRR